MAERPTVELFIRASPIGKEDKGGCPLCHQWFLAFYILSEKNLINLVVTTVNMDAPPDAFLSITATRNHVPIAVVRGLDPVNPNTAKIGIERVQRSNTEGGQPVHVRVCDTYDEIEALIHLFGCPQLQPNTSSFEEREAKRSFEDLYKNLNAFVKNANGNATPLMADLRKLETFLANRSSNDPFLLGDELTFADCLLMPRLQHVRVVGKGYRDWEMPRDLPHVWRYIANMYSMPAFDISCPNDREILIFYENKTSLKPLAGKLTLMPPTRTFSVPEGILSPSGDGSGSDTPNP